MQKKITVLEIITREEHHNIVQHDFEGAIAEAVYLYENKFHNFYLPKELRSDLDYVIQTHKSENRHAQNFLDFMEWKSAKSDTPDYYALLNLQVDTLEPMKKYFRN